MDDKSFQALLVEEYEENKFKRTITKRNLSDLPENDVLIEVHFSSLNYKDALSAKGHKGISRFYPHTPGIDAAGIVVESQSDLFKAGDEVLVTGYDLGMNTSGGFAEYIRVPAEWIVPKPDGLSLKETMIYGTAGFTAGLCVWGIVHDYIKPEKGKILVTGATGGVGSIAVGIFSKLGYDVVASTGKMEQKSMLQSLGASEVIHRDEIVDTCNRPLLKGLWAAVVETVGGDTLNTAIKSTMQHASICVLGNVTGDQISTTVYPFLLRGINLLGIDSASTEMPKRLDIWKHLASDWKIDNLHEITKEICLEELSEEIDNILQGGQIGKTLIKIK